MNAPDAMPRDIFVVTHTQADHHVQGLVGGWYDSELTDLGRRQADALAARIEKLTAGLGAVSLHASDLKRAAQTAAPIAHRHGVPIRFDPDLRERGAGVAGGKPVAWLEGRATPPPRAGNRLDHHDGVEGSETIRTAATRLYRALDRILADPAPVQVVVTHGFAATYLVAAWIGMPLESVGHVLFQIHSGAISHLQEDDIFFNRRVAGLNDRAHLAGV